MLALYERGIDDGRTRRKCIETNEELPTLGTTEKRADDLGDCCDFSPGNAAKSAKQVRRSSSSRLRPPWSQVVWGPQAILRGWWRA